MFYLHFYNVVATMAPVWFFCNDTQLLSSLSSKIVGFFYLQVFFGSNKIFIITITKVFLSILIFGISLFILSNPSVYMPAQL